MSYVTSGGGTLTAEHCETTRACRHTTLLYKPAWTLMHQTQNGDDCCALVAYALSALLDLRQKLRALPAAQGFCRTCSPLRSVFGELRHLRLHFDDAGPSCALCACWCAKCMWLLSDQGNRASMVGAVVAQMQYTHVQVTHFLCRSYLSWVASLLRAFVYGAFCSPRLHKGPPL
jgi:hypothetical protein